MSKLVEENHILGFNKGISLQGVFPATLIVQVEEGVRFLHMLSIACGLLFQHSNALTHTKSLKQMKGHWFWLHTQVLGNTQAGLEPFIATKNVLSLSKRLLKAHTKAKETWFFFMHEDFTLKDQCAQPFTNRQCFGMSSFWRHHPSLYQKVAIDHQKSLPLTI